MQLLHCRDPLDLSLRACEAGALVAAARRSHGLDEAGLAGWLESGKVPPAASVRQAAFGGGLRVRSLSAARVWEALVRAGMIDL
jgi:hypothetical protein